MKQQSPAAAEDCNSEKFHRRTKIIEIHKRRCPRLIVFFDAFPISLAELDPGFLGISSNRVLLRDRRSANVSEFPAPAHCPSSVCVLTCGARMGGRIHLVE